MHYSKVEAQTHADNPAQAMNIEANYSKSFDDDGRIKRTGNQSHILFHNNPFFVFIHILVT